MWWTLSFHAPQQLAAEATLLVLSVLIYFYRVLGGSNEWLRTHGIILVTYYALGGIAYDELEGWTLLDTTYFLTVTVTTVGYGDMCPETPEGKIFTVVYALLGLVFVFAALSPLLDALIFIKDLLLRPCTPKDPTERDDDGDLSIEDLRKGGNWEFKYFSALMGPIIVFFIGLVIGFTVLRLDAIDGIYWSMITMTTIGYGDIAGAGWIERAVLCLYLPTAVAALADALNMVGTIGTAKDLVFTNFHERADQLLLGEAAGPDPDPEETLTEAEFLISVLKDKGIVDELTVAAIRLQFKHITRHDTWTTPGDERVLDDRCVFLELKSQSRIQHKPPPKSRAPPKKTKDGKAIDYIDTKAADGGYKEWREKCWIPRIYESSSKWAGGGSIRLDQTKHPPRDKTIPGDALKPKASPSPARAAAGYRRLEEEEGFLPRLPSPVAMPSPSRTFTPWYAYPREEPSAMEYIGACCQDPGCSNRLLWLLFFGFFCFFVLKIVPDVLAKEYGVDSSGGYAWGG